MKFYKQSHQHYCGIDLHARSLYLCILSQTGDVLLHKECPAKADRLLELITPISMIWFSASNVGIAGIGWRIFVRHRV